MSKFNQYSFFKFNRTKYVFFSKIPLFIHSDRDDLATLVATLDAEINFKDEKAQDPKTEESSREEGDGQEKIKKEETDSSSSLQQSMSVCLCYIYYMHST